MAVDREEFERLDRALRTNARLALERIAKLCEGLEGLSVDELEAILLELMPPIILEHGDAAATVALEWYERQREAAGVTEEFAPTLAEPIPRQYVAADIREAMEPQRRGTSDIAGLVANLQGRSTRLVMRPADETFRINVAADPARPRWAFVPHVGACGFCVMLGSNGWMYSSEQAVLRSRHTNCTCTPVADFDTRNPHLEGYDPEWMREAYARCHDTVIDEVNRQWDAMSPEERKRYKRGKTDFERNMVVAEMNRRDREWLRTGERPTIKWKKPRDEFMGTAEGKRDAWAIETLSENGFAITAREEDAPEGYSNIDLLIGVQVWELKSPAEGTTESLRFVESRVRDAKEQFEKYFQVPGEDARARRVVLSNRFRGAPDDQVVTRFRAELSRHGLDEGLFIDSQGGITRVFP